MDQNIYQVRRFQMAAAVASEEVAVSEDTCTNDGATWTLEKVDLLIDAWQASHVSTILPPATTAKETRKRRHGLEKPQNWR